MPFTDPRRALALSDQKDRNQFVMVKNAGLMAAVSITGIRLNNYYTKQRMAIEDNIARARTETDKNVLLFSGNEQVANSDGDLLETVSPPNTDYRYDSMRDFRERENLDSLRPETAIVQMEPAEINKHLYEQANLIEKLNAKIENRTIVTQEEAGERMATYKGIALKALQKEYPEIPAIINDIGGIRITKINTIGTNYSVHITDGVRNEIINLPKWRSGVVTWAGATYKPKYVAQKSGDVVLMDSFGFNVSRRIKERVERGYFKPGSKASEVKTLFDNIISVNIGDYVDNGHVMKHLLTESFYFADKKELLGGFPSLKRSQALDELASSIEGSRIYMRLSEGKTSRLDNIMKARLPWGTVRSGSEEPFVSNFAMRTQIPFGLGPLTPWSKPTQARANYISGATMFKERYTSREIAARIGPSSVDVVDHLSQHMRQVIPGKMTNIGFYFGPGEIEGLGPGGSIFLVRKMLDPGGKISKASRSNIREFDGVNRRRHMVPLTTKGGINSNNEEITRLLNQFDPKSGELILRKGTWLGQKGTRDAILIEENQRVVHVDPKDGYMIVSTEAAVKMKTGRHKWDQGKMMTQRIVVSKDAASLFSKLEPEAKIVGELLSQGQAAQLGTEILANADQLRKYEGGALGWGIIQKTMSDLVNLQKVKIAQMSRDSNIKMTSHQEMRRSVKGMKEILRTFLGGNIDQVIQEVGISPDTHMPYVTLKPRLNGTNSAMPTTADAAWNGLINIENAIFKSTAGDWSDLEEFDRKIGAHFKKVGLPQYSMFATMGPVEAENRRLVSKHEQYVPTIVRNTMQSGGGKALHNMVMLNAQTAMMTHQQSAYEYSTFAGLVRGKGGYQGGFKATIDHMEIAQAAGLKHYVKYLETLMDYNLDYIRDKWFTAESNFLGPKADLKSIPHSFIKVSGISVIKQSMLSANGINARLAEYSVHSDSMKMAGMWRVIHRELSGLQGAIDDPEVAELINNHLFSYEDLRNTAYASKGRASVDVTDKDLIHDIVGLVKDMAPDQALYYELPDTINLKGMEVKYVPINKFDLADMFELESRRLPSGEASESFMHNRFYTGSGFHSNNMYFFKEMARISEEMRLLKKNQKSTGHLKGEMKDLVEAYYTNMDTIMKGKESPMIGAMFNYRMPFSTRGIINSTSRDDTGSGLVRTLEGIPTDSIYMHEDDVAKLISGGKVQSMKHAKSIIEHTEAISNAVERLKGIPSEHITKDNVGEVTDVLIGLGKRLKKADPDATANERVLEDLVGLGYKRTKSGTTDLALTGQAHIDRVKSLLKEVKASRYLNANEGMNADNIKRTAAIYKYTYDTVNLIKSGNLDVHGSLVGSPELSQWSMNFFKMKIIESKEFSSTTMGMVAQKTIKDYEKKYGKRGIYASKEMVKGMSRDFDFDPIGFVIRTLDVLENQSKKIDGFSILKTASILGITGKDTQMAMLHSMSQETLVETIMSRLQLVKGVTGEDVLPTPASITAITTMDALESARKEGRVETTDLKEYIGKSVRKMYTEDELREFLGSGASYETMIDKVTDMVETKAKKFVGNEATSATLKVMTEVRNYDNKSIRKEVKQELPDYIKLAKEHPELLQEGMNLRRSPEEMRIKEAIKKIDRQKFAAFMDKTMKEETPRFKNIKDQTPSAYNHAKALYTLNFGYISNETDKAFLIGLADKTIAQNTISSKHGTPQVLTDVVATLREVGTIHGGVLESHLDKLARGNVHLAVSEQEKKEMKRLGFKMDDIDLDLYEKYLDRRLTVLQELDDVHGRTVTALAGVKSLAQKDETSICNQYMKHIDINVKNSKIIGESYLMPDIYYSNVVTNTELRRAKEAASNVKAFRTKFAMGLDTTTERGLDESKRRWKSLIAAMHSYSYDNHGISVFDDPAIHTVRSFDGGDSTMMDLLKKLFNHETIGSSGNNIFVKASNYVSSRVIRFGAILSGFKDIDNMVTGTGTALERNSKWKYMAGRETRQIQRRYADRLVEESSVFRGGSIFDIMERKITGVTASAAEDAALHKVGRLKGASLLLGLVAGTIIGQSINQIVSGYPVPDLGGHREGLGGEYYDRRRSFLGRELEVLMSPRPARISSNNIYEHVANRELASIGGGQKAMGYPPDVGKLEPYLKGAIVR